MHSDNSENLEVTVDEVETMLDAANCPVMLVDVRETWELARGILPGAVHMPLSNFQTYLPQLSVDADYVFYCEHGIRSLDVAAWLAGNTQVKARSMRGGFSEWTGPVADFSGPVK